MLLAAIEWSVGPEIFSLGPLTIRWYGLLFALSFIAGYQIMDYIFRIEKMPHKALDKLAMTLVIGTIIGARLGHCLFYDPGYYLSNPIEILMIWKGGLASHGAAIGNLLAVWFFTQSRKDISYMWVMDRTVIVVALAAFFIRMGNFFNSEILGVPADVPWAVIFTRVDDTPRHPAQLYEAFTYLLIFAYLIIYYLKRKSGLMQGKLFGLFLTLVFTARFIIEFVKERQVDFELGLPLDMGQLLSIPFILIGLYFLFVYKKK
ncbi:MAG: prolipoprotein diacylglyceryl transferase [Candidatus Kapaibacterium sp.]